MYSREGPAVIGATTESASQSKAALGLIVRNAFGLVQFSQPSLDFGQENEPFNHIVDGRIRGHCLQHFDDAIAGEGFLHEMHCNAEART